MNTGGKAWNTEQKPNKLGHIKMFIQRDHYESEKAGQAIKDTYITYIFKRLLCRVCREFFKYVE